jgi:AcrR family transcriptional regulator
MPPHADKLLQERILKAAQRLWKTRGAHGLTLRAVAREAGTTTPTVYKRFRSKQAIQVALAQRFQSQLNEALFATPTIDELNRTYLRFAEENPHEYQLLYSTWTDVFHPEMPRPGRALLMSQLANRFGGKPEDYGRAFYALFLLTHGAASLLSVQGDEVAHKEVRENFHSVCNTFFQNIELFREKSGARK